MTDRPNVLFITSDQHRFDAVGYMGHPDVQTPNLDRLAASGVVFERCYVTNPVCMPSRATLLTGQFPDANGVRRNGIEVPDRPWGIARIFRQNGWRTGVFGKTHFCPLRRDYNPDLVFHDWRVGEDYYGFEERAISHDLKDFVSDIPTSYRRAGAGLDLNRAFLRDDYLDWIQQVEPALYRLAVREGLPEGQSALAPELWTSDLPVERHQSTWIADHTMDFIDRHHEEPFFAWCSFVDPHHPFNAPRPYRELYDPERLAGPVWADDELARRSRYHQERSQQQIEVWHQFGQEYRAQYFGMLSLIDAQVGRLVRHLEDRGLAERTLIVFSSDHGEMLGDHGISRKGLFHYEPLIRVPLAFYWPGQLPDGLRQRGLVQNVDLPATFLDAAGLTVPPQYQGRSLLPWCRGERDDSPRRSALVTNGGEGPHYDPWPELRTLVTDRYKLQYYVGENHLEIDDLAEDPHELNPRDPEADPSLVRALLGELVHAGSQASVWGEHWGRW